MSTVIYVGGELPDKNAAGHRVYSNGKALKKYGYNVVFLSEDKSDSAERLRKTEFKGFDIWYSRYPRNSKEWLRYITNRKDICELIALYDDVSAVIIYDPSALALYNLKRFCKSKNISLIADCTEWHTTSHLRGIKRIVKFLDINMTLRFCQKMIDGIIVISSYFENYYKKCKTFKLIPTVDASDVKWKSSGIKPAKETTKFIYAGNMGNEKDRINNIIHAFYNLEEMNYEFRIIGITKQEFLAKFPDDEEVVNAISDKLFFMGKIPHKEVLDHVKNAHFTFLVRESIRKNNAGFPTKFGESITCGTPVIASDFSDVKDYVEKYNLGIMIGSVDNISTGILNAVEMTQSEYDELQQSCLNCTAFDYRNYVEPLGNFIREVCGERL